ncbi:MAG: hypothetical protein K2J11_08900 [Oscillospiraceae bacterium]|nr:hypothetical protein [Oscillospiraceae bacterium]
MLSVFVSTVFAAADLLTAKLVMQPLYGGIITTRFEADNTYFRGIIRDYVRTFEEDIPQTLSPYTMNALLMIFALMAVYYYCFFITGCYIMQCFRYGRKKTLIYYAVAAVLLALLAFAVDETDLKLEYMTLNYILAFTTLLVLIVGFLTNPIIFLYFVPSLAEEIIDMSDISVLFFDMMITFILITIASVEILGSKQFSSKKRIKRIRKNYLAKNNCGEEGTSQ